MPTDPVTLFGIAVLVLILFLPLITRRRARRAVGSELRHLDPAWAADSAHRPHLLYITSPSCSICRSITPWVTAWGAEDPRIHVINAMGEPELMRELGIMGTPTFVVLQHGRVADVQVGAKSEKQIRAWLERHESGGGDSSTGVGGDSSGGSSPHHEHHHHDDGGSSSEGGGDGSGGCD